MDVVTGKIDFNMKTAATLDLSRERSLNDLKTILDDNDISFIDPEFLPVILLLYSTDAVKTVDLTDSYVCWKRPKEIFDNKPYQVVQDFIVPQDIRQGQLGDCGFLSAVAALAEFPQLIYQLFDPTSLNMSDIGYYKLRFCKDGQWQTVVVDDYFPCSPFWNENQIECESISMVMKDLYDFDYVEYKIR